jgi:hypothetical protein
MATATIDYGPGFWDSTGSGASVGSLASNVAEVAFAMAVVTDPAHYSADFDRAFRPEIDFTLTLGSGLSLAARSDGDGTQSAASIAAIFPNMPPGASHLDYMSGGEVDYTAQAAVAPEPSSLALLGIGTTSFVGFGWRRRKQASA